MTNYIQSWVYYESGNPLTGGCSRRAQGWVAVNWSEPPGYEITDGVPGAYPEGACDHVSIEGYSTFQVTNTGAQCWYVDDAAFSLDDYELLQWDGENPYLSYDHYDNIDGSCSAFWSDFHFYIILQNPPEGDLGLHDDRQLRHHGPDGYIFCRAVCVVVRRRIGTTFRPSEPHKPS
jgi:hypothetical protein